MEPDNGEFGARLKVARQAVDLTQFDVAIRIDRRPESVSKYELGKTFPDMPAMRAMAEMYGASLDWLVHGEGAPPAGVDLERLAEEIAKAHERAASKPCEAA